MTQGTNSSTATTATATATGTSSSTITFAPTTSTTAAATTVSSATVPGPIQTGEPADCDDWILQSAGVYCYDMATNAGISLACLYQLKPALNTTAGSVRGCGQGMRIA